MMKSSTKWVGTIRARLIVSIGVAGALALGTQTAGQSDTLTTNAPIALGCQADPGGLIASLPPGGVFDGYGACYVTNGILIDHPNLTVQNATFIDPLTAEPATTTGYDGLKPMIRVKDTAFITLTNLTLNGQNGDGGYHRDLVGQEGVDILSSSSVTLNNIVTNNTFGDGLTVGFQPRRPPSTNLAVNGYTIDHAGRQGVTLAYVNHSTLNDVTINSSADAGWDFESDLKGVGSGSITINRPSGRKGFLFQSALNGPVIVNDSNFYGGVSIVREAASSAQPVVFKGGTILIKNVFNGIPPAGIWVKGPGNITFDSVAIGRQFAIRKPTGMAWLALSGASLSFIHVPTIPPPWGANDASSTVTIIP